MMGSGIIIGTSRRNGMEHQVVLRERFGTISCEPCDGPFRPALKRRLERQDSALARIFEKHLLEGRYHGDDGLGSGFRIITAADLRAKRA